MNSESDFLPMMKLLSDSDEDVCGLLCEMFILYHRRIPFDQDVLLETARRRIWLKPDGTPLFCLGNILANEGLYITRQYNSTLDDVKHSLELKHDIIVGLNCEKLYDGRDAENNSPNHVVVVTCVEKDAIIIFDPQKKPYNIKVSKEKFLESWADFHNYMVRVLQSVEEYEPHPISVEDMPLAEDLRELQEAIAENAHEVWAKTRKKEGWKYGKLRDDDKKEHPDMVPYLALPESEKEYDRKLAFDTIKIVEKLGFRITKIQ